MGPGLGVFSADTLEAVRQALGPVVPNDLRKDATTQGITVALGLQGYNLEAPAKLMQPQVALLRNRIPRKGGGFGTAVHWKKITAVNATKIKATGFAEGARNSAVSFTELDALASYKDFGLDGFVTFEAIEAGRNFEDVRARGVAGTLQATMIEEEKIILGGNVTAIGKPASLTAADGAGAGPFTAVTAYDFAVSALTAFGVINAATGHASADALDETDARTLTTYTTGSGKTAVTLTWPAVRGAMGYNVYIGTHSGTRYYAFTTGATSITITSAVLNALPVSGNVANTTDQTADANTFDGVWPQQSASAGSGYFKDLAGAALTADNAGGIKEWDDALQDIYVRTLIGPGAIYVSAQEARNAVAKILTSGTTGALRLSASVEQGGTITGGIRLGSYLNKFTQEDIPVLTHGYLPAGNTLMLPDRLPYPNANVPNVIEMDVRQEYTQYDWALTARKNEFGVYGSEVLKHYFPAGGAVLAGIGNG